jgi:hypothetical protein
MSFTKLEPIKGGHGGCLCCGYQHDVLPLDALIAVGFGYAAVTKNGEDVYNENDVESNSWFWTCERAEEEAAKDPENDWRIHLVAPLSERHYQRQGDNHWVLYEKGLGFA